MHLEQLIKQWDNKDSANSMEDAEELIYALRVEVLGKNSIIDALQDDLRDYDIDWDKDWNDQEIQDAGLGPEGD